MIIGITGLIGSGKSTVSAIIAERTGMMLFDMDSEFQEHYKERNRAGEVVPAADIKEYQRTMLERLLSREHQRPVVMAGFFLDMELPRYLESREEVLWVNLVTERRSVLEERIKNRKGHFAAGVPILDDNWPIRHDQVIGTIMVDCAQPVEDVVDCCLSYIDEYVTGCGSYGASLGKWP